jgi:hypothetical protein
MNDFQLSAQYVASIILSIFAKRNPSIWDSPHFGGDPFALNPGLLKALGAGSHAQYAEINPQPLPPRLAQFSAQVNAVVGQIVSLDHIGALLGGEVTRRAEGEAGSILDDFDELCPRLPKWWPHPHSDSDIMDDSELFLFGMALVAGSQSLRQEKTASAMVSLAQKMVSFSTQAATVAA